MAAVKALARVGLQHQSLLHLVGTRLRATTANSPLMIAGADLVAPSTSTRRPSQTKRCAANNWIAGRPRRRAVDGAARYDNPPLLCKCRRAPSTQVETGDLARVHRRMVSHTPAFTSTTAGGTRWKDTTKPPVFPFLRIPGEHSPVFASSCAARIRKRETAPNKLASHT